MIPSLLQLDGQKVYRDRMREEGWARASETDGLFATVEVRQILELVRQFKCRVDGCKGHFKLVQASTVAHGGSVKLWFRCSGHGCVRQLIWCGSSCVTLPRRLGEAGEQVVERVGFGKVVAAILSGQLYRDYSRQIAAEGSQPYEPQRFNEIVVWILPYTTSVLDAQVKHGRDAMKKLPPESLGSSKRAVTCADGYWQVRGYTSPNGTATVSDWLTRAIIGYGHCCQRGVDIYDFEIVCSCGACDPGAELSCLGVKQFAGPYKYTSKSMEADKLFDIFNDLRSDAIMIERNVADGDGGSDVVFKLVFPEEDSQHQLCGGHHNRAVISRLMKAAAMKTWPATKVELERAANGTAPMPLTCDTTGSPLRCHCSKHKAGCGCIGANFLQRTRLNHTLCMQQAGSDPDKYEALLSQLMAHIEGNCEECSFHPKLVCSCELKCGSEELVCDGKPYEVTYKLTCPFHIGAAKRILTEAAAKKDMVISRDLGKVTSNPSETIGKCLTDLRDKSHVLNAMHYKAKSNLGLMLANQTYMLAHFDADYHFKLDVMAEAGLEIPVGFKETCRREIAERLKLNEKAKTEASKRHRYNLKAARQARGEEYKKNSKDCRTARVGQYLSGATLDLDDADVEIDDSMVDMDNEVDVPDGLGHEALLVDLQRRTQQQAAHRRQVQVAGIAAINGGSSTAPKTPKGVAGACTCGATCVRSCPCSCASPPVDCTEKCHPANKKCKNCVAGRSSAAQGGASCLGLGGAVSVHGSRKPTPPEVSWTKGLQRSPHRSSSSATASSSTTCRCCWSISSAPTSTAINVFSTPASWASLTRCGTRRLALGRRRRRTSTGESRSHSRLCTMRLALARSTMLTVSLPTFTASLHSQLNALILSRPLWPDAEADVAANLKVFAAFVPEMSSSSVVSIHQAVLRARVLRANYFNGAPAQREILEARALVQDFVRNAADGEMLVLPAATAAARAAAHNEAERLGLRHETTESAPGIKAVPLVNLPLSAAVFADAPTEEPLPEM